MNGSASATQTVAEAHSALRARDDIQFDLPSVQRPPGSEPLQLPGVEIVFWIVIAIGVALLVYLLIRLLMNRTGPEPVGDAAEREVAQWRPEETVARALLADADAMADAGRFDEAARLLLHRSLEEIAKRKPRLLKPALTSREIARAPLLPDAVRNAFAAMAAPVERSLFGGRALDREAWEAARAAYGAFALPKAWA